MDAIPMSARGVHPSQLGVIDPIRTTESRAVGIDQRMAAGAKKGSDGHVYFPVRDRRTGEVSYKSTVDLHSKVLAFPQGKSLAMSPHAIQETASDMLTI